MQKLDSIVAVELQTGALSDSGSATLFGTKRDVGTARKGLLIVSLEAGSAADVSDYHLVTGPDTSAFADATLTTASTKVEIEQAKFWVSNAATGPGTALTITDNAFTIPADSSDVVVVAQVSGLQRWVQPVLTCSSGSSDGHLLTAVLLAGDGIESPIRGERAAH